MDRTEIGNCIIAGLADGDNCLDQMSEIVTRLELAGWVIVPKEPTQEMLDAVTAADQHKPWDNKTMAGVYREMIHAALWPS